MARLKFADVLNEHRQLVSDIDWNVMAQIPQVNFHRLKPVAFVAIGSACPPSAVVSIHQLKLVVLKSEE